MAGRKTKYTPETIAKLTEAIGRGATHQLACDYAGISRETFYEWLSAKPDFSDTVKAAEGSAAVDWLTVIDEAAKGGAWQAAAWKLERRYPQDYGRKVTEIQGKDGAPIAFIEVAIPAGAGQSDESPSSTELPPGTAESVAEY